MSDFNVIPDIDRVKINLEDMTIQDWNREFMDTVDKREDSEVDQLENNILKDKQPLEFEGTGEDTGYFLSTDQLNDLSNSKKFNDEILIEGIEEVFKQINLDEGTTAPFGISENEVYEYKQDLKKDFHHINLDVFSYEIGTEQTLIEEIKNRLFITLKELVNELDENANVGK